MVYEVRRLCEFGGSCNRVVEQEVPAGTLHAWQLEEQEARVAHGLWYLQFKGIWNGAGLFEKETVPLGLWGYGGKLCICSLVDTEWLILRRSRNLQKARSNFSTSPLPDLSLSSTCRGLVLQHLQLG